MPSSHTGLPYSTSPTCWASTAAAVSWRTSALRSPAAKAPGCPS